MGVKFGWRLFPVTRDGMMPWLEYRPYVFFVCDLCGTPSLQGESEACDYCRRRLSEVAAQASLTFGQAITAADLQAMFRRPEPHGITYGRPWRDHLPPHERRRYGVHA